MPDRVVLRERLCAGLVDLQLHLDAEAIERLLDYVALLVQWNSAYNLTAVRDPQDMITRHLLDSLSVAPFVTGRRIADVGSGAGLPGIPLAILEPRYDMLLIDSNGKKARFLREAVRQLQLKNVTVAESRVEALSRSFDCILVRAFSSLARLLAKAGHLLADDGRVLAQKGRYPHDEIAAIPHEFEVVSVDPLKVPHLVGERHLVTIRRRGCGSIAAKEDSAP